MPQAIYDYHYGIEAEQYVFFRIPKLLMTEPHFRGISTDAKLLYEAPEEEQNFETVIYMIENAAAREDDEDYQSPLDMLLDSLEERDPNHIALKRYKVFKQNAGKTAKSVLVSAVAQLPLGVFPAHEWLEAADYLCGDKCASAEDARNTILERA